MPPGGHIDDNETPEEAARRECKEETGLDVEIIGEDYENLFAKCPKEGNMLKKPIAMLLENIPASEDPFGSAQGRRGEPAHQHMDFLYVAQLIDESQEVVIAEKEAGDWRWFTREDVEALDERMEIFGNVKEYILELLTPSKAVQIPTDSSRYPAGSLPVSRS